MSPRIIEEIPPENCAVNLRKNTVPTVKNVFEPSDKKTLSVIREDLGRQLGLASERRNAMVQTVGIMAAFASVLFLQVLATGPALEGFGILFIVSMGSFLFCCIWGAVTFLNSRDHVLSAGVSLENGLGISFDGDSYDLEAKIAVGMCNACRNVNLINTMLSEKIAYMVMLLTVGVIASFAGWCI
ncbi:MAG: hypothetical protein FWG60_04060 [Methanomassiliicoccaceae archaeon]|nr:hypothetical protein [Methanomassiliicoccaceae archaeon]